MDRENGSVRSQSDSECSDPTMIEIPSMEWTNGDEGINCIECEHPTSNDLRHLHKVEPNFSIGVNGWWRGPCKGDEGWANGSSRR